jgi:hypothetical protein
VTKGVVEDVMAKKKKTPVLAAQLRRGEKTSDDIRRQADTMREQVGELLGLAQAMDDLQMDRLVVDGVTKIERGVKLVDDFVANLEAAISKEKRQRRRDDRV